MGLNPANEKRIKDLAEKFVAEAIERKKADGSLITPETLETKLLAIEGVDRGFVTYFLKETVREVKKQAKTSRVWGKPEKQTT